MTRITHFVVLVAALMSLFAVLSSSAGAVTWHNTGNTSFDATANAVSLSATNAAAACPAGGTMTGTVGATPAGISVWTAVTGTVKWAGCILGTTGWTVDCAYALTATNWQVGPPSITSNTLDLTCSWWNANLNPCHIEGTVEGHYTNPVSPSTFGKLTITTGGNLTVTNGRNGQCPLGVDDKVHFTGSTFTIQNALGGTGTLGPIITRTS